MHDLKVAVDRIEEGKHFLPEGHPERIAAAVEDLSRPRTETG